jgi:MYXO-CTERM domain-containing protein
VFTLSNAPGFDGFPSVDFVPTRSEWVVVWTTEPADNQQTVAFARVPVTADAALGPPSAFWANAGLNNYPEVACDRASGECLAITWFNQGNPDVWGCKLNADALPGAAFAVAATPGFEGGDGIGLAFSAATGSWLAVYQGPETPGQTQEVFATEVDGAPLPQFQASTALGTQGIYQPRVAAHSTKPELFVVMSVDYTHVGLQKLVGTGSVTPADAGDDDAGGASDSGTTADGGKEPARGGTEDDESSCGCRTQPSERSGWWLLVPLALAYARARTRRHGNRTSNADAEQTLASLTA